MRPAEQDLQRDRAFLKARNFAVKILRRNDLIIVNLCDEESLGTIISGDGIDLNISEDHFGGDQATTDEALSLMKTCKIANLVGDRIVRLAIESDLATPEAVKKVGGTSFLMIFR